MAELRWAQNQACVSLRIATWLASRHPGLAAVRLPPNGLLGKHVRFGVQPRAGAGPIRGPYFSAYALSARVPVDPLLANEISFIHPAQAGGRPSGGPPRLVICHGGPFPLWVRGPGAAEVG